MTLANWKNSFIRARPISAEYGLEVWFAPTESIRAMSLDMKRTCVDNGL
jgi:hypothetical protein